MNIYTYIGVCGCVYSREGKSASVQLRRDALRLRCVAMRCDAKRSCVRVRRAKFPVAGVSSGLCWAGTLRAVSTSLGEILEVQ